MSVYTNLYSDKTSGNEVISEAMRSLARKSKVRQSDQETMLTKVLDSFMTDISDFSPRLSSGKKSF